MNYEIIDVKKEEKEKLYRLLQYDYMLVHNILTII